MHMRLARKVAIVTGGDTGIGRVTAQLFAKEGGKVSFQVKRQLLKDGSYERVDLCAG